jgi:hypothetical protein
MFSPGPEVGNCPDVRQEEPSSGSDKVAPITSCVYRKPRLGCNGDEVHPE